MHLKETIPVCTPTFDDIALENKKRLELMGIKSTNRMVFHLLLQMMSCMGELSNLACRNELPLSPFEQREVRTVIGNMAVCLTTFGEAFDINLGEAAMEVMEEQIQKVTNTTATSFKGATKRPTFCQVASGNTSDVAEGGGGGGGGGGGNNPVPAMEKSDFLLSPTSNREFFGFLDELIKYNKSDFEKAELKWVAPLPDGKIQELIENGSNINVQYEDIPKYLACVERYRSARTNESQQDKKTFGFSNSSFAHAFRSNAVPVGTGGSQVQEKKELSIFSPNLGNERILSPGSRAFTLPYDKFLPKPNAGDTTVGETGTVLEADFYAKVDSVKRGLVTGQDIAQLNLTFSVPRNGKLVELIPNGIHLRVTAANVAEFLRLISDKTALNGGKVRRLESIKRLEVSAPGCKDLSKEKCKFSPTHFSKDIFAPYEERTSFIVDCEDSDEILPAFIKEMEQQQQKNTESQYVRVVRQGDVKSWMEIIAEVKSDQSALKKYGVTFCVPKAILSDTSEQEQSSKVHELIKDGIKTPVEEAVFWLFCKMIEQYI